jgi:hypothetical protein
MPSRASMQFYVVTREPDMVLDLQRVVLTQTLQATMSDIFAQQGAEFLDANIERVPFEATFTPARDAMCVIKPFTLPRHLQRALATPQEFSDIKMPFSSEGPVVKAILAVDASVNTLYFQHFDKSHILQRKFTVIFKNSMFQTLVDPGIVVAEHLTAVIQGSNLFFRSFYRTKQFIDLEEFYREASDTDIRSVLQHDRLCVGDADGIIAVCTPSLRKKFSIILDSKILDNKKATPDRIQRGAKKFGIDVQLLGRPGQRKVVVPSESRAMKELLQYLAEELYISDITEQPCETNSYRRRNGAASRDGQVSTAGT